MGRTEERIRGILKKNYAKSRREHKNKEKIKQNRNET